jgi:hypothetical protein
MSKEGTRNQLPFHPFGSDGSSDIPLKRTKSFSMELLQRIRNRFRTVQVANWKRSQEREAIRRS